MRPLIVSHSDSKGGAARAAWRLHQGFLASGQDSRMLVGSSSMGDWRVSGPRGKMGQGLAMVRPTIDGLLMHLQKSPNPVLHSPAWLGCLSGAALSAGPWDVINLHWTCAGFASIRQLGKITRPVVWTLHDMWAFCGAEHYDTDGPEARWRQGYTRRNRPPGHGRFDLDRWAWARKARAWKALRASFVAPSSWLAGCAAESALLRDKRVAVIPNALDLEVFKPLGRQAAREILGLPADRKIVLFGALDATSDRRKGWDLLKPALEQLAARRTDVICAVFGSREPRDPPMLGMPIRWFGHLADDYTLALLYSAADVMAVPSRQENLAQSATEAQACGCPVVAFDVCGNPDAVAHRQTGYLAAHSDPVDFCQGMEWILEDPARWQQLSAQSRQRAARLWSMQAVVRLYEEEFRRAVS